MLNKLLVLRSLKVTIKCEAHPYKVGSGSWQRKNELVTYWGRGKVIFLNILSNSKDSRLNQEKNPVRSNIENNCF